jgi:hypothetical protein
MNEEEFQTLVNAFCPTGEGGGIDPTCGSVKIGGDQGMVDAVGKHLKHDMTRLSKSFPVAWEKLNDKQPIQVHLETGAHVHGRSATGLHTPGLIRIGTMDQQVEEGGLRLGKGNVSGISIVGTVRHELGHELHDRISDSDKKAWTETYSKLGPEAAATISKRASRNEREGFAEAFTAYTHRGYKEGSLPPMIEAYMKRIAGSRVVLNQLRTVGVDFDGTLVKLREGPNEPDCVPLSSLGPMEGGVVHMRPMGPDYGWEPYLHQPTQNTRWRFHSSDRQLEQFRQWLETQMAQRLTSQQEEQVWRAYILAGWKKGAGRAFDQARLKELRKQRPELFAEEHQASLQDFYRGSREEFLRSSFGRPVSVAKVKLLASRTFDDLKNVTHDVAARIRRKLVDGLIQGTHPQKIAREMAEDIDGIGLCQALDGIVVDVDEASGLIPAHPG